jgi:endonuclease/exonuclease/phosphatase family metal-dependent hydrolase
MRRALLLLVTMALALLLASGVAYSQTTPTANLDANTLPSNRCSPSNLASAKDRPAITVMSRNLYLGADLSPIFAAASRGDGPGIIQATTNAWATINATNFPERAETLADEIEHSEPLLVGLQEVSLFRTGPFDSFSGNPTPAEHVELDYLNILMRELERRDLNYTPVTITNGADGETPGFTAPGVLQDIRLTDRDVILVRTDMPDSKLQHSNEQTGTFANFASAPLPLLRGWGSVDVTLRGQTFRFINTHLEQEGPFNAIQVEQGNELLSGPANTNLPVILVGDFNSRADGRGTETYSNLIEAGFTDAWSATRPGELGNTWGHDENLLNTTVDLTQRIDLVLFRDNLCALDADVVGDELTDRTPSGLWPSDHAGVVATLRGE